MSAAEAATNDKSAHDVRADGVRRVGLMGGMFDPIHLGHIQAAGSVRQQLNLDSVLMVPCGNPVHRGKAFASADDRCAMLAFAIAPEPWLQLDRRECRSAAPSYTVDTLTALHAEQPEVSWHLMVGVDAFLTLPSWKQWQQLFALAHIVVMTRPGYHLNPSLLPFELLAEWEDRRITDVAALLDSKQGSIFCVDVHSADLSSTLVRHLLKTAADPGPILHPAVAAYIQSHGLYQSGELA